MTDAKSFINEFLQHASDPGKIREYNRQYYLRNRKLKGRTKASGQVRDNFNAQKTGATNNVEGHLRDKIGKTGKRTREARLEYAWGKLNRAYASANALPPKEKAAMYKDLDRIAKKLQGVGKKINADRNTTEKRLVDRKSSKSSLERQKPVVRGGLR